MKGYIFFVLGGCQGYYFGSKLFIIRFTGHQVHFSCRSLPKLSPYIVLLVETELAQLFPKDFLNQNHLLWFLNNELHLSVSPSDFDYGHSFVFLANSESNVIFAKLDNFLGCL